MDKAAFDAERLTGLGSSDAAAVLGVSKWRTPLEIYLSKRRELPEMPDNPSLEWGRRLEPVVLAAFKERLPSLNASLLDFEAKPPMVRHTRYPWMIAHLDAYMPTKAVVEAKTARTAEGWGEDGSDQAPVDYVVQAHHQMICTGLRLAYLPVLIGGSDFRVIELAQDDELSGMIIDAENDMWQRINNANPPAPRTLKDVEALYAKARKGTIVYADQSVADVVRVLSEYKTQQAQLDILIEECERQIKGAMGEADTLEMDGMVLATWKETAQKRLDTKLLKAEAPDVWEAWAKETKYRRFLIKSK